MQADIDRQHDVAACLGRAIFQHVNNVPVGSQAQFFISGTAMQIGFKRFFRTVPSDAVVGAIALICQFRVFVGIDQPQMPQRMRRIDRLIFALIGCFRTDTRQIIRAFADADRQFQRNLFQENKRFQRGKTAGFQIKADPRNCPCRLCCQRFIDAVALAELLEQLCRFHRLRPFLRLQKLIQTLVHGVFSGAVGLICRSVCGQRQMVFVRQPVGTAQLCQRHQDIVLSGLAPKEIIKGQLIGNAVGDQLPTVAIQNFSARSRNDSCVKRRFLRTAIGFRLRGGCQLQAKQAHRHGCCQGQCHQSNQADTPEGMLCSGHGGSPPLMYVLQRKIDGSWV